VSDTSFLQTCLHNLPMKLFPKFFFKNKATYVYVAVIIYDRMSTFSVIVLFYIFIQIFLPSQNPV
jgi:hypothetical protein